MLLQIIDVENDNRLFDYIKLKAEVLGARVFRFCTLVMYGEPLDALMPLPMIMGHLREDLVGDSNSIQFDMLYADQLANRVESFCDLMKLLTAMESSPLTIVICNHNHPGVTSIIDALVKNIQVQYGLQAFLISSIEDIDENCVTKFDTKVGLVNYIRDEERYRIILQEKTRYGGVR